MIRTPAGIALSLLIVLSACGGEPTQNEVGGTTPTASPATQQTPSVPVATPSATVAPNQISDNPQVVAKTLKSTLPEIGKVVKITEDNDDNKLLGRPGQYDAATFMQDKRLKCSAADDFYGLSIDCGAKIERWASQEDAQARADDIQKKLKAFGLGAEYDYVRGRLLLRVAGALKPSQAKQYKAAFLS